MDCTQRNIFIYNTGRKVFMHKLYIMNRKTVSSHKYATRNSMNEAL